MSKVNELEVGVNYKAAEIDQFISKSDAVILSSNENQLFANPERQFRIVQAFEGYFEHSAEDGEKYYRTKNAYVIDKV
ncbi:hypothetical protein [Alkalicoccobacillus plakortidis]|uniref:Uncharacterized protein n=1 Tax=Alkalicoccobacillus plakortidis TaxID=444060 RepID=A0ABT0XNQ1_9BACI|nr:hypothetical protein [Alkalicoccobacillus plakortidis]MCM2677538.1 hypothetical protein [Alkalicoccobacillus plakortidis]